MTENNMYEYEVTSTEEPVVAVSKSARVKGIIGMILGILGLTSFYAANIVFPIAGLILSSMAKKGGETKFSKVGKITSMISLILSCVAVLIWIIVFVVAMIANM